MYIFNPCFHFARHLARKGELDRALFWSGCRDIPILSAAGMALQVLNYAKELSPYRIIPLLQLGQYDEAFAIFKHYLPKLKRAQYLGKLAALMPEEVLQLPNLPADIEGYCLMETGALDKAEKLALSPFMSWKLAIHKKRYQAATTLLHEIFHKYCLEVPQLSISEEGIRFEKNKIRLKEKNNQLITVIMTCYNEEKNIDTAIRSILSQSYTSFELIIVDDGSSDATPHIIKTWAARDSRIISLFSQENRGTWQAKNYALEKASGEFIMMHDADDWSHPDKLKLMYNEFRKNKDIACVSSKMIRITELSGEPFSRDISNFVRWNPSSLLFRRSFIQQYGDYANLLGSDCEIAARHELLFGRRAHVTLPMPLSIALARKNSLSSKFRGSNDGKQRIQDWETWRFSHVEYLRKRLKNFSREILKVR